MRRFFGLAAVSASQIAVTFVAQLAVIKVIGAGAETDALFASTTVPQLLVSVLVVSISQVLIARLALRTEEEASRIASFLTLLIGGAFAVVAVVLAMTSRLWLGVLFPALRDSVGETLVVLAAISFLGMVFQAMEMIVWAFHHSRGAHMLADATGLAAAVLSLAVLVPAMINWGIQGAAWALALRPMAHLLLMLRGVRLGRVIGSEREWLREMVREAWPPVAGALYYKFDVLIDRVLAALAGAGSLSVYYLGHQMSAACTQVMSNSLANPALPVISRGVAATDASLVRRELRRRAVWILGATLLLFASFALVGKPALVVLFGESLSGDEISLLFLVFLCLAGVVAAGGVGQITAGTFYALGQSRTPTVIGIVTYTAYIPLKILAFRMGGLTALALSVTAFYSVNVFIQGWVLSRRIRRIDRVYAEAQ